ncbi:hypothetical protein ACFV0R_15675 [Streptomyces sp. NPDC059578]|uniref:hypothetical protein n=1 Tax=Streptomyces sp. NPDC059578 TaxID=3346874 RepID=UPI0036C9A2BB
MNSGRARTGVAEAAAAVMSAVLSDRYPRRPQAQARADARALVTQLRAEGWQITAPEIRARPHPDQLVPDRGRDDLNTGWVGRGTHRPTHPAPTPLEYQMRNPRTTHHTTIHRRAALRTITELLRRPAGSGPPADEITGRPDRPTPGATAPAWTMPTIALADMIHTALYPTASPTPFTAPTAAEVTAAVETLARAWAPGPSLHHGDDDADEDDEDWAGCGCGGDDEDGEPLGCTCAPGCVCESCAHQEHQRAAHCQARHPSIGGPCTKATEYRVTAYVLAPRWATAGEGATCTHAPADCPCALLGTQVSLGTAPTTVWTRTACSAEHALVLITDATDHGLQAHAGRWVYAPHDLDLPDHVATARAELEYAASAARCAALGIAGGRTDGARTWWAQVRAALARAAVAAVHDPIHGDQEDDLADVAAVDTGAETPDEPDEDAWVDADTEGSR